MCPAPQHGHTQALLRPPPCLWWQLDLDTGQLLFWGGISASRLPKDPLLPRVVVRAPEADSWAASHCELPKLKVCRQELGIGLVPSCWDPSPVWRGPKYKMARDGNWVLPPPLCSQSPHFHLGALGCLKGL